MGKDDTPVYTHLPFPRIGGGDPKDSLDLLAS